MVMLCIMSRKTGYKILVIICVAVFFCVGCDDRSQFGKSLESIPNLIAYWDFADDDYLTSQGVEQVTLRNSGNAMPELIEDGAVGGRALRFDGDEYLNYLGCSDISFDIHLKNY